ncbi:MAG: ABC transporter substrate-binding protein [SAR324 cluster bacterium]|jgi:arginine/ornithine transport system substrate-binding protein|nr:ABC transporter substrate-binding protein [SAR324 cluster bacterium]MCH2265076.1 ABC transporter substrate-binding protein [SAR324 cluster bacterium]|tara:strand:- start:222 stop:992 length:771 start_codon:yes stop_codon:yes gene_type:complete
MKKLIAAAVVAMLMVGTGVSAKEWKKIRVGVEGAYPPFSWVESDGTLKGFDIEIAMALCKEIGAECTLVTQDWDGIIPALLARKYDAIIASMSITEERKKKVAFSEKYYNSPAKFARKKGSGITISKAGLKGKSVGVQRATTHDNFITGMFGSSVDIKRYATQDEAYLDAVAGRIDLLLADSIAMEDGFLKTDNGKGWEFVGPGYSEPKYFGDGAGIATRKQNSDLAELFSKAIKAIRANGVYKSINDKYFAFDIY